MHSPSTPSLAGFVQVAGPKKKCPCAARHRGGRSPKVGSGEINAYPAGPGESRWDTAVKSMGRSEEHTSELQSLMRISYAVFCLKKKKSKQTATNTPDKQ